MAGLTTKLYTFRFTLAGNLLSQITPDTFLHPFHLACTLLFTTLSQLPFSCTVDPTAFDKYRKYLLLAKGPFPQRAWKRAFFVSFIDLRLKQAVKIEASAKKKQ